MDYRSMNEKLPLTRSPIRPPPPSASRARLLALRAVPLLLLPAIYLSDTYSPFNTGISQLVGALEPPPSLPLLAHPGASCPVQHEMKDVPSWKPEEDQEYIKLAIERLQGAVQIPTESYDDMADDPAKEPRFEIMSKLHEYLAKTFPLVHDKVKLEKVATYGLLYTWEGSESALKPIVLMAHQDVVPVNPTSLDRWTYPPFSAKLDKDGWIWGRGVADCKNTLIGILSAMEQLVKEDFRPTRTIILSFGFDEEIGGRRSARPLAETLLDRYGKDGISLLLDEGFTGVDEAYNRTFARLGMAEKGALHVELEVLTPGGHSSVPPKHTGLGIMSLLLVELEKHPDTPRLRAGNPTLSYLNCAADYGEMDHHLKRRVRKEKEWQKLGEEMAKDDPITRAFLATTQAADLIQGGIKVNALPEFVTSTINYRIDFLSSVNATLSRIASLLSPVVDSLDPPMTFDAYGSHPHVNNSVVRLKLVPRSAIEPAPLTPSEGGAWELMSGSIKHVFEGAVVAPSAMIANTDTKWTWDLTRHIYRFVPAPLSLLKNFHTVDERIHVDAHISGIHFFHKLIRNSEQWTSD